MEELLTGVKKFPYAGTGSSVNNDYRIFCSFATNTPR